MVSISFSIGIQTGIFMIRGKSPSCTGEEPERKEQKGEGAP
jgi:hypothetical protein